MLTSESHLPKVDRYVHFSSTLNSTNLEEPVEKNSECYFLDRLLWSKSLAQVQKTPLTQQPGLPKVQSWVHLTQKDFQRASPYIGTSGVFQRV